MLYSKQSRMISAQFHLYGTAENHRIWIAQDINLTLSLKQCLA